MSFEFLRNSKLWNRGSILIASLWAISVFSVFIASLGFQGTQHALLMKRELENLEAKADFLSGLHLGSQSILSDPEPHEDSFLDEWWGNLPLQDPWKERLRIQVEDEESKLNLNSASESFLQSFLKLFSARGGSALGGEEEGDSLKGERKDFVKQVLKRRGKERIGTLEELYLLEDIEKEDLEKLRPFLTVSPEFPQLNINTAPPLVLKALIESLTGDDLVKEELSRKILEFREKKGGQALPFFRSKELEPNAFLARLRLSPSPSLVSLLNQFLPQVTTDSRTFRLTMKARTGKEVEAVIQEKASGGEERGMEVLSWHES